MCGQKARDDFAAAAKGNKSTLYCTHPTKREERRLEPQITEKGDEKEGKVRKTDAKLRTETVSKDLIDKQFIDHSFAVTVVDIYL